LASPETLLALNRAIVQSEAVLGEEIFRDLAEFFTDSAGRDVLDCIMPHPIRRRKMGGLIVGLSHLGVIAGTKLPGEAIGAAMKKAGFREEFRSFPSEILARELALETARPSLPMTVLAARGVSPHGSAMALEVFLPSAPPDLSFEKWLKQFGPIHLAYKLKEAACFAESVRLMEEASFFRPRFMASGPQVSSAENISVLYFDGKINGQPLRVEFVAARNDGV